ncbi:hypothetical protein [Microbulbifer agarilyticus]|uniref:hypothetical protein n=1 Tax=Microbulbifer agarilyticus TaxID=260552 RepID=UPI0021BBCC67|nr:hypothetical protein [Microbulbifer agarilyticus]
MSEKEGRKKVSTGLSAHIRGQQENCKKEALHRRHQQYYVVKIKQDLIHFYTFSWLSNSQFTGASREQRLARTESQNNNG